MINITYTLIKELRERTGAGMMECKKALIESRGHIELAIDNMRKSGQAKAAKKTGRIAVEGFILNKVSPNGKYGVIIELNCETDFVAKDDNFKKFGDEIINTAIKEKITDINTLKNKFEEQRILLISKFGENINIRRMGILEGEILGFYVHGIRIGVIVSADKTNKKLIRYIAMHIAANKPEYINEKNIPTEILNRERQVQLDIAMQSGKSREITEKIIEGRMYKFIQDISLTGQPFLMNPDKTVGQVLKENDAKVNGFIRFELGEGLKKNDINFAAEVASMINQFN